MCECTGEKNVNNVSMEIAAAGSEPIPRVSTCDEERERVEENPVMRGKYREYKQYHKNTEVSLCFVKYFG